MRRGGNEIEQDFSSAFGEWADQSGISLTGVMQDMKKQDLFKCLAFFVQGLDTNEARRLRPIAQSSKQMVQPVL
jgi:hypothetical protein